MEFFEPPRKLRKPINIGERQMALDAKREVARKIILKKVSNQVIIDEANKKLKEWRAKKSAAKSIWPGQPLSTIRGLKLTDSGKVKKAGKPGYVRRTKPRINKTTGQPETQEERDLRLAALRAKARNSAYANMTKEEKTEYRQMKKMQQIAAAKARADRPKKSNPWFQAYKDLSPSGKAQWKIAKKSGANFQDWYRNRKANTKLMTANFQEAQNLALPFDEFDEAPIKRRRGRPKKA